MEAKPKVVAITGEAVALPGMPNQNLVEFLDEVLEKARSGEIVGMAGTMGYSSKEGYVLVSSPFYVGFAASHSMIGALERVKYDLIREMGE